MVLLAFPPYRETLGTFDLPLPAFLISFLVKVRVQPNYADHLTRYTIFSLVAIFPFVLAERSQSPPGLLGSWNPSNFLQHVLTTLSEF